MIIIVSWAKFYKIIWNALMIAHNITADYWSTWADICCGLYESSSPSLHSEKEYIHTNDSNCTW